MQWGILDDVTLNVDGIQMRASVEAIQIVPQLPGLFSQPRGCWYDDGREREWIQPDSSVAVVLHEGTARPKIPMNTDPEYEALLNWIARCKSQGVNPVFVLTDEGDIMFDDDAAYLG